MCSRLDPEFYAVDLLSDILSRGKSSRLYNTLIKEKKLFTEVNAYPTSDFDKGLFVIEGKIVKGVSMDEAEKGIDEVINSVCNDLIGTDELEKVKNKVESTIEFSEMDLSGRALNLAIAAYMGDVNLINTELVKYRRVTGEEICTQASSLFKKTNCSTLHYLSGRK